MRSGPRPTLDHKLKPLVDAEKAKAQAELDALGDVTFAPGLIGRFLNLFSKR